MSGGIGDHDEVFAVVGDGLAQQFRIEPCERSRIWTIEDEVVNSSEHALMTVLIEFPRCCSLKFPSETKPATSAA